MLHETAYLEISSLPHKGGCTESMSFPLAARSGLAIAELLNMSSTCNHSIYKTAKARFDETDMAIIWPWLEPFSVQTSSKKISCPLLARRERVGHG